MSWIQVETGRYENGSGWILENDPTFGWIMYNEEMEDEFPDTFLVLADLFTNPGLSVITLDPVTGRLPTQYLPALAINDTFIVSSQVAMLSLSAERGDIAVRTDLPGPGMFILAGDDPAFLPNWIPLTTTYPDWNNIQNKPAVFPTVNHDHDSRYYTKSESDTLSLQKRNIGPIPANEITEDLGHRFVSDIQMAIWDAPNWNNIQNKPVSFPPSSHDHDSRYYTKFETDTALLQKRNLSTPIPATEVATDSDHRFVTDAQMVIWNSGGGGLSNPLNQDINFAIGRILRLNNTPVAGWLDDGTPYFKKRLTFTIAANGSTANIAHGISSAFTNKRIIGYEFNGITSSLPSVIFLFGTMNTGVTPNTVTYDNTNLHFTTDTSSGTRNFTVTLTYV
ncbi:hypothetical protein [Leptospira borgpetersenii]|uniref:hypothetical protein n=1 Tax=Leptospira borgpetersenii TaxID=174 RepID=UPI0007730EDA|nr:hypothetical protein [Leptospira borgpetersenii]